MPIPTDAETLNQVGITAFCTDQKPLWPVSDLQFEQLTKILFNQFDHLFSQADHDLQNLLLVDFKFIFFLSQYIHANLVHHYAKEQHQNLKIGQSAQPFYQPNWPHQQQLFDHPPKRTQYLRQKLAYHIHPFILNQPSKAIRYLWRNRSSSSIWSLGHPSLWKRQYIQQKRIYATPVTLESLFQGYKKSDIPIPQNWHAPLQQFFHTLDQKLQTHFQYPLFVPEQLQTVWTARLKALIALNRHLQQKLQTSPPKQLLLTETANPWHKLIAITLRQLDTKIIGFHHDNDMANIWMPSSAYLEIALCDQFVCPTKAASRFHKMEYERSGIASHRTPEFPTINTNFYHKVWEKNQKFPAPKEIKSLMVMGHPLLALRYLMSAGNFFAFQANLAWRLGKRLRQWHIRSIYKGHPETTNLRQSLFNDAFDQFQDQPFEKVWHQSDAFLFSHIATTTFGFALCTNRPIFILDIKNQDWNMETYALLKKRCIMIPAWFDQHQRLMMDEDLLRTKLQQAPSPVDHRYIEAFMRVKVNRRTRR
ncbi:hypothetical protein ACQZV8_03855 [Magnetococcales bacterium HHB-1]